MSRCKSVKVNKRNWVFTIRPIKLTETLPARVKTPLISRFIKFPSFRRRAINKLRVGTTWMYVNGGRNFFSLTNVWYKSLVIYYSGNNFVYEISHIKQIIFQLNHIVLHCFNICISFSMKHILEHMLNLHILTKIFARFGSNTGSQIFKY